MNLFGDDAAENDEYDDGNRDVSSSYAPISPAIGLQPPHQSSLFIGQDDVEQQLLNLWNANRMPHAIVLNGLKGIGKATLAYRLARFVLKQSDEGNDLTSGLFGGEDIALENLGIQSDDPVFSRVASGGHTDMMVISRPFDEKKGQFKNEIPVEDIRKIAPFLRKTSGNGGWRIVIVDDANTMNRQGQNAILKILEEPPKKALLILVTHGAGGLLPTIRSRCRFIQMQPLSSSDFRTLIHKFSDAPIMPADEDILNALSGGSIGQAVHLMEDDGIQATHIILDALGKINDLTNDQIDSLALSFGRSGDTNTMTQFNFILNWWFETLAVMAANGMTTKTIGAFELKTPVGHDLKSLLRLHEDVATHIETCINGALDKRYMIYKALRMVQG